MTGSDDRAGPDRDDGGDGGDRGGASSEADGWLPEIEEIRRRRELALAMGGQEKVRRQVTSGRLTVRERIGGWPTPAASARSAC